MNSSTFSRIELVFWNFAIRALSQSDVARAFLKEVYTFTHNPSAASMGIAIGLSGVAGLVSGYLFYFVRMGLR